MPSFSIGFPEKNRIELTFIEVHKSVPGDPYPWAKARVKIDLDNFSGETEIYLDVDDVIRFKTELDTMYKDVSGASEFKTTENQFFVRLEMDSLGHVAASGFLRELIGNNKLNFEFTYDQTLLKHTISEIDETLRQIS